MQRNEMFRIPEHEFSHNTKKKEKSFTTECKNKNSSTRNSQRAVSFFNDKRRK